MSLLMGPAPRDKHAGIEAKVTRENPKPVKITGAAGKLSKAFHEALDSISFQPAEFAWLIHSMPVAMQHRFLDIVHNYFRIKSDCIDRGMHAYMDENEYDLAINGRRIHQTLNRFQ